MLLTKLLLLIVGAVTAVSTPDEDTTFSKDIYEDDLTVYSSQYDIVNILVPTNSFNFDENDKIDDIDDYHHKIIIFFVEADVKDGKRIGKGLYILKNRKVTKLLDNGRDAAASADDTKEVFFAAKDGIYIYNAAENKAEKYGSVTDNIIALAKENGTDVIYYKKIYRYNVIRQIYGPPLKELLSAMYDEKPSEAVYRSLIPLGKKIRKQTHFKF